MALQAEEDAICGGCGQPIYESMSPHMEGRYDGHLTVCHACAEKERYLDRLGDEKVEPGGRIGVRKAK